MTFFNEKLLIADAIQGELLHFADQYTHVKSDQRGYLLSKLPDTIRALLEFYSASKKYWKHEVTCKATTDSFKKLCSELDAMDIAWIETSRSVSFQMNEITIHFLNEQDAATFRLMVDKQVETP